MDLLKHKGQDLAETAVEKTRAKLLSALAEELPGRISVEETAAGVVVSGKALGEELIDNNSLRDVAFLMRGVR